MAGQTTKPLTIRVDETTKRKFFAALALNGETMQSVLARAVDAYIEAGQAAPQSEDGEE